MKNKPHSELVQTLLQHDAEHNNRDRRISKLFLKHQQLPDIMPDTSPQQVRDCLETFSDTMTEKYKEQLEDSYNYYCLHCDGEKGVYMRSAEKNILWHLANFVWIQLVGNWNAYVCSV